MNLEIGSDAPTPCDDGKHEFRAVGVWDGERDGVKVAGKLWRCSRCGWEAFPIHGVSPYNVNAEKPLGTR
jgi:hypothetical protein